MPGLQQTTAREPPSTALGRLRTFTGYSRIGRDLFNLRMAARQRLAPRPAPCQLAVGQEGNVPKDRLSPHVKLRSVSLKDVQWTGGFWGGRYEQCRRVVTPNLWRVMQLPDNAATFNDLKMAGGLAPKAGPG